MSHLTKHYEALVETVYVLVPHVLSGENGQSIHCWSDVSASELRALLPDDSSVHLDGCCRWLLSGIAEVAMK